MYSSRFLRIICLTIIYLFFSCSNDDSSRDNIPPEFAFPDIPNSTGPGTLQFEVEPTDNQGIKSVEVYINGILVISDGTSPYLINIALSDYESGSYQLTIRVLDLADNSSEQTQNIDIDADIPVITQISLSEEVFLSGDDNILKFNAFDDDELKVITVIIDDLAVFVIDSSDIDPNPEMVYEVPLITTNFKDGSYQIKIIAEDSVGNIGQHTIPIIFDNTAPVIEIPDLTNDLEIFKKSAFEMSLDDEFSSIITYSLTLNDSLIKQSDNNDPLFEIDPYHLDQGSAILYIEAYDEAGNGVILEKNILITRLLFELQLSDDYLDFKQNAWVLASDMNGKPITFTALSGNDNIVRLYAPDGFDTSLPFNITVIYDQLSGATSLETISSLHVGDMDFLTLDKTDFKNFVTNNVTFTDFQAGNLDNIVSVGPDYILVANSVPDFTLYLDQETPFDSTSPIYILTTPPLEGSPPAYFVLPRENVKDGLLISANEFVTDRINTITFSTPGYIADGTLELQGFGNDMEFNATTGHSVKFRDSEFLNDASSMKFSYISGFPLYRHSLAITSTTNPLEDWEQAYLYQGVGLPLSSYSKPAWEIAYDLMPDRITLSTTGMEHEVGEVIFHNIGSGQTEEYSWRIFFDSQNTNEIILPEIPTEINSQLTYDNNLLSQHQVAVSDYSNISDYLQYLGVAKSLNKRYFEHSEFKRSMIKPKSKSFSYSDSKTQSYNNRTVPHLDDY